MTRKPPHHTVFKGSAAPLIRFLSSPALHLRVIWSHWTLDSQLAAGVDPASDPALIVRAGQLRSPSHRRRLAAWVERLVKDADAPPRPTFTVAVPLAREQVLEARDSLLFLAHLLRHADRLRPRGVAMVQRLLSDAGSVLYTDTVRGAVELEVRSALDCLVDSPEPTPEAWFSVGRSQPGELHPPPVRHGGAASRRGEE